MPDSISTTPNAKALKTYAASSPKYADIFGNVDKLKKAYSTWEQTAAKRSPGADFDANGGAEVRLFRSALRDIYNIND